MNAKNVMARGREEEDHFFYDFLTSGGTFTSGDKNKTKAEDRGMY